MKLSAFLTITALLALVFGLSFLFLRPSVRLSMSNSALHVRLRRARASDDRNNRREINQPAVSRAGATDARARICQAIAS